MYYHCVEWNESPQDAILKVQQKLFDNGLTAFDPEDQLEASRENAVKASITASLKLLAKDEEIVLFSIASSFAEFGIGLRQICKSIMGSLGWHIMPAYIMLAYWVDNIKYRSILSNRTVSVKHKL